jgi:hypothetical protein
MVGEEVIEALRADKKTRFSLLFSVPGSACFQGYERIYLIFQIYAWIRLVSYIERELRPKGLSMIHCQLSSPSSLDADAFLSHGFTKAD